MNDLAEKALELAATGARAVRSRAMVTLAVLGCGVSVVIVVTAGRVGAARATRPLTSWLGLQPTRQLDPGDTVPGAILLAAVVALALLWLTVLQVLRHREVAERSVWGVLAAWALPLALGPPAFDTGVYSYAAFGLIQRPGHDPYTTTPSGLGYAQVVEAVDPAYRGTPSGSGPLAGLVQHLAASVAVGSALGVVIVLRVVAVLAVVWLGRSAADLGGRRRSRALASTVLNPLLLLYVVSAARLEGLFAALVLACVVAANRRARLRATVLAAGAASLLGQGFVVVLAVLAAHLGGRRTRPAWQVLLRDLVPVLATVVVLGLIVPDGFGWLRNVRDQFAVHTPFSIADATGALLGPVVRGSTYDTVSASSRSAAVVAMVVVVVAVLLTAGRRPLERTAAYALLAVGLLAPTCYPWYVLAGVLCLAPSADAVRAVWVRGVSIAACLVQPGGFGQRTSDVLTAVGLGVVAIATLLGVRSRMRRDAAERPASGPSEARAATEAS